MLGGSNMLSAQLAISLNLKLKILVKKNPGVVAAPTKILHLVHTVAIKGMYLSFPGNTLKGKMCDSPGSRLSVNYRKI